jgi:hypothetical protein
MTLRAHTGKLAAIAVLTLLLSLASSSAALGQESAKREYNPPQSFVASGGGSGGDDSSGSADSVGSGSLPFTGMDLGLAAGGALLLIGAGAALATVNGRRRVEQS